ncbi:Holliday junction resolvase RuvX [Prosthecochloris sp. N3]|uniref:Putative pre-16S rRNA nuclease n=1 Tax=Prosthecochloris ethylica TaxID=2743976 RepID=A0ABR9XTN7_9CHLB|nr:Holliday junction resolvase RuvX [Prosthecochloris sp. ZM_2]MBF0587230.1 Holliday junction resolvase RuvX [Prosthecochloris ethylica]MEC9486013.1 Holliday junction resolvase RuvX [Prosthecochloris sp.]MBF0637303.1 Holliday junction resolvase RuvX [Prosthecochloris ethylica]NUK48392.1 Holliday junction resolvase RuvX [Prosthecochloris ethylica]RNA65604.1 Holliday junction resolvase RuvX [Prosthecochloris sp. ZM_2]
MSQHSAKRILGVDYGTKRIGLAKSDPLHLFAQPVGTFNEESFLKVLRDLLEKEGIERIIIGYPLNADGSQNRMTAVVDSFIERLHHIHPDIVIETLNEYGTSQAAGRILIESGMSRKKRRSKGRLDSASACVLLQNHLDSKR